jgi:hypothetical protein
MPQKTVALIKPFLLTQKSLGKKCNCFAIATPFFFLLKNHWEKNSPQGLLLNAKGVSSSLGTYGTQGAMKVIPVLPAQRLVKNRINSLLSQCS